MGPVAIGVIIGIIVLVLVIVVLNIKIVPQSKAYVI
ncbi:MAG TPA: peptidase, partial [Ruminococcaceae bacterium]|nr:peptidase [Oscillospiraceae bacterium]